MSFLKMIVFTLLLTQVIASQTRLVIDKVERSYHLTFIQKKQAQIVIKRVQDVRWDGSWGFR